MKRIVVISDSHGNKEGIDKIFNNYNFDYLIFLGDCLTDLGYYANIENVFKVRGNCDFFSTEESFGTLEVEGLKIFYCHGHEYNVKKTYDKIACAGKLLNADLVLCGHTHSFFDDIINDIRVINCPALGFARGGEGSFLILEVENKKISIFKVEI